jgi:hypothetical protein
VSATIGVDDRPDVRIDHRLDGCIQHSVDELRIWMHREGPTDDQSVEAVDDGRKIYLAGRDLELGDVG